MARSPKSSFVNRLALQKAFRGLKTTDLLKAVEPVYKRGSKKIRTVARRNAPRKTGKLAGNIKVASKSNPRAGKGSIATYTVYSRSIQDMVTTYGIPNAVISGAEATKRSRTINGRKHRLRAGFNYSKGLQLTKKTGKKAKRQPLDKNGRPWAFGRRKANPFMTEGQTFEADLERMAVRVGNNIRREIANKFAKNIKISIGKRR